MLQLSRSLSTAESDERSAIGQRGNLLQLSRSLSTAESKLAEVALYQKQKASIEPQSLDRGIVQLHGLFACVSVLLQLSRSLSTAESRQC